MKKLKLSIEVLLTVSMISCGGAEIESNETTKQSEEHAEQPVEESYEPYTRDGLVGEWLIVDGSGYSKASYMGKTFTFTADSVKFYHVSAAGEKYVTGTYEIIEGKVDIINKVNNADGSTTTGTNTYEGGFTSTGLQFNDKMNGNLTFEKQ